MAEIDICNKIVVKRYVDLALLLFVICFSWNESQAQSSITLPFSSMNNSNNGNYNVNHLRGVELQDIKRSIVRFFILHDGKVSSGSGSLLNTVNNSFTDIGRKFLLLTADHVIPENYDPQKDKVYLSFNYEWSHSITKPRASDVNITKLFMIPLEAIMRDSDSDIALLEVDVMHPVLPQNVPLYLTESFSNAYALGWTLHPVLDKTSLSNCGHPQGDIKKVYNDIASITEIISDVSNENLKLLGAHTVLLTFDRSVPEKGVSGSPLISKNEFACGVVSGVSPVDKRSLFSLLDNSWYLGENNGLINSLDPGNTWVSQVKGGYMRDLLRNSQVNMELNLDGTTMEKEHSLNGFKYFNTLMKLEGFKTEQLLGNGFLQSNSTSGIAKLEILSGDAELNPLYSVTSTVVTGLKPFNAEPSETVINAGIFQSSDDLKANLLSYYESKKIRADQTLKDFFSQSIPVKIQLSKNGAGITNPMVKAIKWPGEMPYNAVEFFAPESLENHWQSNKVYSSRGISTKELFIDNITVSQNRNGISKSVPTGNNGGYLNLANPNYLISTIKTSYKREDGTIEKNYVTFKVDATGNPYYCKIWIDYFPEIDDTKHYNFVGDTPSPHLVELMAETEFGPTLLFNPTVEMPDHQELGLAPGKSKVLRMRVAISSENNITQHGKYDHGEVEDYLIRIQAPTRDEICEDFTPVDYKYYAKAVLPYCGSGGYLTVKESMPYQGGFLAFDILTEENIQYAKTKTPQTYDLLGRKFIYTIDETVDGTLVDQDLMMDVYYPLRTSDAGAFKSPLVIYIFGGGFIAGDRNNRLAIETCEWLAEKGYVVAAIDYRLGMVAQNGDLAKRAVIRAWQDSRAAVQYWRGNPNDPDDKWKIDRDKVYVLGHSAGGVTALHNVYLSADEFTTEMELGNGFLKSCNPGFDVTYKPSEGPNKVVKVYDLTSQTTTVCLTGACDTQLSSGVDAQANRAVSFAGALGKKEWAVDDILAMDIHHFDDGTVSYQTGRPFGWIASLAGYVGALDVPAMDGGFAVGQYLDPTFTLPTREGVDTFQEKNNFKLQSLSKVNQAGMGNSFTVPYHYPQLAFDVDIKIVEEDTEGTKLAPQIMYLVDAFFTKNRAGGSGARLAGTSTSNEETSSEEREELTFNVFPNPATDHLSVLVEVRQASPLKLEIVDLQGKRLYVMKRDDIAAGHQLITLRNLNLPVAPYVLVVEVGGVVKRKKLLIE